MVRAWPKPGTEVDHNRARRLNRAPVGGRRRRLNVAQGLIAPETVSVAQTSTLPPRVTSTAFCARFVMPLDYGRAT